MDQLSDELLLDAFQTANKYNLDQEFIQLLNAEINRRQINAEGYLHTA
ncbi:sporulation histidine kinase inhibitor Sda [Paenibacillus sp. OV219]|nr:sporulation histidine kinase inhibitor Sda [Paenibacillus sp. OV219]SEO18659.1 Sporulation inhibitor A [Paenibacillus sp. OV219]